ncbi:MAG: hypothetical protein RI984_1196 [Pseudomonadota bacterium]
MMKQMRNLSHTPTQHMRTRLTVKQQKGMSLIGLLCTLFVFASFFWLAIRVVPSMLEFWAIEKAVAAAKVVSKTPAELRVAFDKIADASHISTLDGKSLVIQGTGSAMQISFSYQKVIPLANIPLAGPASLMIDYRGSTDAEKSGKSE